MNDVETPLAGTGIVVSAIVGSGLPSAHRVRAPRRRRAAYGARLVAVRLPAGFRALKAHGFCGWLTMECKATDDPESSLRRALAYIKRQWADA